MNLTGSEQYIGQMAGISTAALGYWKEGDSIHPSLDTVSLRDVAKLYAKYAALHAQVTQTRPTQRAPMVSVALPSQPQELMNAIFDAVSEWVEVNHIAFEDQNELFRAIAGVFEARFAEAKASVEVAPTGLGIGEDIHWQLAGRSAKNGD